MGLSIYKRKEIAIKQARKHFPVGISVYDALDVCEVVLDAYIAKGKTVRRCAGIDRETCDNIISETNKTGLCRKCYRNKFRRNDQQRRLDALHARERRKRLKEANDKNNL